MKTKHFQKATVKEEDLIIIVDSPRNDDQINEEVEEEMTSFNDIEPEVVHLLKPQPMKRTTSLEYLADERESNYTPEPPPRIKIYSINPTDNPVPTKREIKSILKIRSNKNVQFNELAPQAYSPQYHSPYSSPSYSNSNTPDLSTPPLTPAPVLLTPGSPPLVPSEYRRGLLKTIDETSSCETDSLEGDGHKVQEEESDEEIFNRHSASKHAENHQGLDFEVELEVKRDYVSPVPARTLRDMRKQQQDRQIILQDENNESLI